MTTPLIDGEMPADEYPSGYFSQADMDAYRSLVRDVPFGGSMVEVGVFRGRSLCSVAKTIIVNGLRVWGVDPWRGLDVIAAEARDNMQAMGLDKKVILLRLYSHIAATFFHDGSLDLVFIDGPHDRENVERDIAAWLPKVKYGGVICGHDFDAPEWPGVRQAVESAFGAKDTYAIGGSLVWAHKVGL